MPMQGSLKEMSLANLIQVNCQEMRSARLTLAVKGQNGGVYFSDGQVVHAEMRDRVGKLIKGVDALYTLLLWEEGTFTLDTDIAAPETTIQTPWSELVLEGMKRLAEWQAADHKAEGIVNSDLVTQLGAIEGVTGAVIAATDGVVLASAMPGGDGEQEAAIAVFVGSAAQQMGDSLGSGRVVQGAVTLKNRRVLVFAQPDRYIGLWLGENASPAIVSNAVTQLLRSQ